MVFRPLIDATLSLLFQYLLAFLLTCLLYFASSLVAQPMNPSFIINSQKEGNV